jgi:eukaryotic-like serine/threonine-protein kinase
MDKRPITKKIPSGTRIRETYTVERYLGSGRFSDVYLVRHRYLGMQAMKVLVEEFEQEAGHEAFRESFVLSRITHPGVVRVYDANRTGFPGNDHPYITLEYVSGGTLAELIGSNPLGLSSTAAFSIMLQVAQAVSHAHRQEPAIVHRDLKPANILLETGDPPVVRVADFGLAKAIDRLTNCVSAAGTLLYMSPESLRGFETTASDVYAMGLILYELLTGVLPFQPSHFKECKTDRAIRERLANLQERCSMLPTDHDPAFGPDSDYLLSMMTAHSITQRLQTAGDCATLLRACVSSRAVGGERWPAGPGYGYAKIGFRVAHDASRYQEAVVWLDKARTVSPDLRGRLEPFFEYFSQVRDAKLGPSAEETPL